MRSIVGFYLDAFHKHNIFPSNEQNMNMSDWARKKYKNAQVKQKYTPAPCFFLFFSQTPSFGAGDEIKEI